MDNRQICNILLVIGLVVGITGCSEKPSSAITPYVTSTAPPEPAATGTPPPTPTSTPLPLAAPELAGETIHNLCLVVNENYDTGDDPFTSNTRGELEQLFSLAGIPVVADKASCDATMQIALDARGVSAEYGTDTWCYTGSHASGKVTLTMNNGQQAVAPFDEGVSPPWIVTSCPRKANQAPINLAVSRGLMESFRILWSNDFLAIPIREGNMDNLYANMAAEVCLDHAFLDKEKALPCLIQAASVFHSRQTSAIHSLEQMSGKALPAVPALLDLLEKSNASTSNIFTDLQDDLVKALVAISGEDYGTDVDQWRAWYEAPSQQQPVGICSPGGIYSDAEGDVEEGYLDLLQVETRLDGEHLTVIFFLNELPERLPINERGAGMDEGSVDYYWGVDIDTDQDDATGVEGSWGLPASGIDQRISLFHFISGNDDFSPVDQFIAVKDTLAYDQFDSEAADVSLDFETHAIMLSAQIPGISEKSELHFLAFKNFPDYARFVDFACEEIR